MSQIHKSRDSDHPFIDQVWQTTNSYESAENLVEQMIKLDILKYDEVVGRAFNQR